MWDGYYEPYPFEVHCAIVGVVRLMKEELSKVATTDVAPVVHGRWVEHFDEMECPVCKRQWNYCDNDTNTFNFCPNCGAKMDIKNGGDNDAAD